MGKQVDERGVLGKEPVAASDGDSGRSSSSSRQLPTAWLSRTRGPLHEVKMLGWCMSVSGFGFLTAGFLTALMQHRAHKMLTERQRRADQFREDDEQLMRAEPTSSAKPMSSS